MFTELKIIGFMLIGASGLLTSLKILSGSDKSVERTEALAELISAFRIKIDALCIPIPSILAGIDKELLVRCGYDRSSLPQNADELIEKCSFYDDKALYKLFCDFTSSLGRDYKKEELTKCMLAEEELTKLLKKRKEEREKRRKTAPAVCLCISAGIIILLI